MLNVISKKTEPSSRDAMMDESHKKGNMRLYAIDSQKAQSLTGKPPQSNDLLKEMIHLLGLIKSNQVNLKDTATCNMGWGNHR